MARPDAVARALSRQKLLAFVAHRRRVIKSLRRLHSLAAVSKDASKVGKVAGLGASIAGRVWTVAAWTGRWLGYNLGDPVHGMDLARLGDQVLTVATISEKVTHYASEMKMDNALKEDNRLLNELIEIVYSVRLATPDDDWLKKAAKAGIDCAAEALPLLAITQATAISESTTSPIRCGLFVFALPIQFHLLWKEVTGQTDGTLEAVVARLGERAGELEFRLSALIEDFRKMGIVVD